MRVRPLQIALSLAIAVVVGQWWAGQGHTVPASVVAAVAAYALTRLVIAWAFRTRYWLRNGDRRKTSCENCGGQIYRLAGDWLLTCHRCGWRTGLPALRWLTRSVPSTQLRRTARSAHTVVAVLAIAAIATGAVAGVTVSDIQDTSDGLVDTPSGNESGGVQQPGESGVTNTEEPGGYDVKTTETMFVNRLNEERTGRGLGSVDTMPALRNMAVSHSEVMADAGRLAHSGLRDGAVTDRFEHRGLLPRCNIEQTANSHYTGAENAAKTWTDKQLSHPDGNSTYRITSNEDLAEGLFTQWMHSQRHREIMLEPNVRTVGLGYVITDDGTVYAALEMCGN